MEINAAYLRERKAGLMTRLCDEIEGRGCPQIVTYTNVCLSPLGQCYDDARRCDARLIFEDTGYCAALESVGENQCDFDMAMYGGFIRLKWGHFITESIARLWALYDHRLAGVDKILFFVDRPCNELTGNYRELFDLLGITDRVVICDKPVKVSKLIVPDLGYEHDRYYTAEQAAVYHRITEAALKAGSTINLTSSDKIFLSRAGVDGAAREAVNLVELEQYFAANGYRVVSPEKLSLVELIVMMSHAKELASISGTPAHNFAFAPDPSAKRFIILERHAWVNSFQLSLDKMLGLPTEYVDAFYLPRPASAQDGLMLFAPTPQFCAFAKSNAMTLAGEFVSDKKSVRRAELRRFLTRYRRYWCSGTALCPWETGAGEAITEALSACSERYNEWMKEALPIMWYDYLTPRVLVRAILRSIKK